MLAAATVVAWLMSGPLFGFSDTWQLVINTGTTIVTFLMVFLIQNTQNRDTEALQLKLDELIRTNRDACNRLLDLEDLDEDELERVKAAFERLPSRTPTDRPSEYGADKKASIALARGRRQRHPTRGYLLSASDH
jgi:low affinity Fe/Cu permease